MSGRPIRCIAFDFDGTLVDSNAIKRESYFVALGSVDGATEVIEAVLREHPRADRHGILAHVHARLEARGAKELPGVDAWVAAYSQTCEARVIACPPLPGAVAALDALVATRPLYLASATPEDALQRVVAGRGWTHFFRGVYGGPRSKPENLARIAAREGLEPCEIAYVGDGAVDREAAERFGCRFHGYGDAMDAPCEGPLAPLVAEIVRRTASLSAG
jgi:phosphoglycolate phosphatase-like HAD superfamily hydrolase